MNIVKLQIPIDKDVRDALQKRAGKLGFDSVQAYIRFWAKAEVDGRLVHFGEDDWGEPSPKAAARLDKLADEALRASKSGKLAGFDKPNDALNYLHNL